ncbi:hypothetical protein FVE85_5805 [Porphyridium purpureum]|uniref:Uncharacterized protein n=1 Tax=Porphyridium purpureum TaxID=35688 RepID=A0A5J4Z4L2_PORPP|nr:hypothetical protein FVE85_5805 [Porphyridium purpureum]|eukprot:POR6435..scf295_1
MFVSCGSASGLDVAHETSFVARGQGRSTRHRCSAASLHRTEPVWGAAPAAQRSRRLLRRCCVSAVLPSREDVVPLSNGKKQSSPLIGNGASLVREVVPASSKHAPWRAGLTHFMQRVIELEQETRPVEDDKGRRSGRDAELMRKRFDELPEHAKTDNQILGRITPGCEGTQGVFPRCTFGCKPCYHSEDANRVRTDGAHTAIEVARQMQTLQDARGSHAHCQLIGGEVSLLSPEEHAQTLSVMHAFGRLPMSFSHGDFDYEYLERLALDPATGRRRFKRLDWAVHFDRFMVGRRGIPRPNSELELMPYRANFMSNVKKLFRQHGVRYYVAHNMTIQAGNLHEIADVIRHGKTLGFRMFSFQPAALVGDVKRWRPHAHDDADTLERSREKENVDDHGECVWQEIEKGAGCRLPYEVFQIGDVRCNRTCWGAFVGRDAESKYVPFLLADCKQDLEIRDTFLRVFGSAILPLPLFVLKLARCMFRHPWTLVMFAKWCVRFVRRAGVQRMLSLSFHPVTFVMHRFMDAEVVKPAWELLQKNEMSSDPRIRETQERLQACSYAMAHPDTGELVPACAQHSVYDPDINKQLAELLPITFRQDL